MNMGNDVNCSEKCKCPHHSMGAVFAILFGLTFLLGSLEVISAHAVSLTWPILIILAGLMKIIGRRKCKCC